MSAFTGRLKIEEIQPGRRWRLLEPIRYEAGAKGSGHFIEVPAGFETDGATIPPFFRVFLAVWGTYGRAAALHDYLYSILRSGNLYLCDPVNGADYRHPAFETHDAEGNGEVSLARRWADNEFHMAMIACGTARPLAWLIWLSVRVFGAQHVRP